MPPVSTGGRWGRVFILASLVFAALLVLGIPSLSPAPARASICVFREATGIPCGMCGGTRAVRALAAGDWDRALYLNPAVIPVLAVAGLLAGVLLVEAVSGRRILRPLRNRLLPARRWILVAGFLVLLVPYTIWHAYDAIVTPKPELTNLHHPIVQTLRNCLRND